MHEAHNIGTFLCLRGALQLMRNQDFRLRPNPRHGTYPSPRNMARGAIVILTSLVSEGGYAGIGSYVAAKHACKGLVQTAGTYPTPFSIID